MSDVTKDDLREVADEIRNKLDAMTAERDKWKTAYGEIETKLHEEAKLVDETRAERDTARAAIAALRAKPSDEDVERAAIAAATAHYGSFVWERAPQEVQDRWRNIARATIAALDAKEPS